MKKFMSLFSVCILGSIFSGHVRADIYVGGSFSNMMNSKLGWEGSASADRNYYLIECPAHSQFCNGGNLKWDGKDKQSVDVELTKKMSFSGAVGYFDNRKPFRLEAEYLSISNNLKESTHKIVHGANLFTLSHNFHGDTLKINALMGNVYYSMKVSSFKPYVGAGIGYIKGKASFIHENKPLDIKQGIGFQFMLGAEAPVGKGIYAGLEFRHVDFGALNIENTYVNQTDKLKNGSSSGILLKARYELSQDSSKKTARCKSGKCKTRKKRVARRYSRDDYYY